ncbi:MAG TPA: hypothetical protein VF178_06905 [Gemmatimonadaceae bacterium]
MPHVLLAEWVPVPDRDAALARWREVRSVVRARGANFWVFESPAQAGRALEFIEARDAETLRLVCEDIGAAPPSDILTEVELS